MEMKIHINHLKTLLPCLLSSVARSQGRRPRGEHSVCKEDRSGIENWVSCLVLGGFGKSSKPPCLWHPFPEDAVLPMRLLWAQRSQHGQSSQDWSWHGGRCLGKLPVVTWHPHGVTWMLSTLRPFIHQSLYHLWVCVCVCVCVCI